MNNPHAWDDPAVAAILARAVGHHRAGRAAAAEAAYREALAAVPDHPDALHLLRVLAHQSGRADAALEFIARAVEVNPSNPEFHCNIADVYRVLGRLDESLAASAKALELKPDYPEALSNRGIALRAMGRVDEAIAAFGRALELRPGFPSALNNLGNAYKEQDRLGDAETAYRQALAADPKHVAAASNLGVVLKERGRLDDSVAALRGALAANPDYPEAHHNLGLTLNEQGLFDDAAAAIRRAIELRPGYAQAHSALGTVLYHQGRHADAVAASRRSLELDPERAETHSTLGAALELLGELDEAMIAHRRALDIEPDRAPSHNNLGFALQYRGAFDEAMTAYRRAIELKPDFPDAHRNAALTQLLLGRFGDGFEEYEWRWRCADIQPLLRDFSQPLWDGGPLEGKTILVWGEQGVGDEVMFASLIPEVIERAKHCVIECDPRLVALFGRSFPEATVIARAVPHDGRADAPDIDLQAPIADLARWLRPTLESFAPAATCLRADPARVSQCRGRYRRPGKPLVVGISWRSGNRKFGRARSAALDLWEPLFRQPGVRFVNLQYGDCTADLAAVRQRFGVEVVHDDAIDPLTDMDGFAAQVAAMDLIVSIDNSTVHLAGALGVAVLVMLPFVAEWRWLRDREDSIWYTSPRLYRQDRPDDWPPVFERVRAELARRLGASAVTAAGAGPVDGSVAGSPAGTIRGERVALVNDTSAWYHWGCTCTSVAIREALEARGAEVAALPIDAVYGCREAPETRAALESSATFKRFRDANPDVIERLAEADRVVINGEGTLHGVGQPARALLYLAYAAKVHLGKPVHIVNHSCFPENTAAIGDAGIAGLYRAAYEAADGVAVREEISARLLDGLGIETTLAFDCLPLFVARHHRGGPAGERQGVVIAGSVAWSPALIESLSRLIGGLAADGVPVRVLVGARARPARDDQTFLEALRNAGIAGWDLVDAASAEDWLDVIAGARLLVSGRFHHSIAAAALGTPFVVFNSNTPKIDGLMALLGHEPPLAMADADALRARATAILDGGEAVGDGPSLEQLCALAERNFASLGG